MTSSSVWDYHDGDYIYFPSKQLVHMEVEIAEYKQRFQNAQEKLNEFERSKIRYDEQLKTLNRYQSTMKTLRSEVARLFKVANDKDKHLKDLTAEQTKLKEENFMLLQERKKNEETIKELMDTCSKQEQLLKHHINETNKYRAEMESKEYELDHYKNVNLKLEDDVIAVIEKLERRFASFPNEFITVGGGQPIQANMGSKQTSERASFDRTIPTSVDIVRSNETETDGSNQQAIIKENNEKNDNEMEGIEKPAGQSRSQSLIETSSNATRQNSNASKFNDDMIEIRLTAFLKKKVNSLLNAACKERSNDNMTKIALYFNDICYLFIKLTERMFVENKKLLASHHYCRNLEKQLEMKHLSDFQLMECIEQLGRKLNGKIRFQRSSKVELLKEMAVIVQQNIIRHNLHLQINN